MNRLTTARKRKHLRPMAAAVVAVCVALMASCARQQPPSAPPEPPLTVQMPPESPISPVGEEEKQVEWRIVSSAFEQEGQIPARYTCDGDNISPQLEWTEPLANTAELALICDDPDAPGGTFVHWVIYGIAPDIRELPENLPPQQQLDEQVSALQGQNDTGKAGYTGPCPPPGPAHRYYFRLYALSEKLELKPGATKAGLLEAMEGKILAEAEMMGRFTRQSTR